MGLLLLTQHKASWCSHRYSGPKETEQHSGPHSQGVLVCCVLCHYWCVTQFIMALQHLWPLHMSLSLCLSVSHTNTSFLFSHCPVLVVTQSQESLPESVLLPREPPEPSYSGVTVQHIMVFRGLPDCWPWRRGGRALVSDRAGYTEFWVSPTPRPLSLFCLLVPALIPKSILDCALGPWPDMIHLLYQETDQLWGP